MAAVLFLFPIIFLFLLFQSRYYTQPMTRNLYCGITIILGLWAYSGRRLMLIRWMCSMDPNLLNVFVSVVFVNSPTVFGIVRGITLDIKTRDYVAAAQTRGEGAWYIAIPEILPNARGPLIVDFCLRIGYTTILLGTLASLALASARKARTGGQPLMTGASCCRFIRILPCRQPWL